MTAHPNAKRLHPRQAGIVLVISLIFLIILTLIGVTAMQVGTLEERMAGHSRDMNLALQAAEAALRDAERDIRCVGYNGVTCTRTLPIYGLVAFDATCTQGLCYNGPTGFTTPIWDTVDWDDIPTNMTDAAFAVVSYGRFTGANATTAAPALPTVAKQPRYIIEGMGKQPPGTSMSEFICYYRITARGYGASADTVVTLQEFFTLGLIECPPV